jgi:hypothetical protein
LKPTAWLSRRLDLAYLDDGLVVSAATGAWGWWQLATVPYELLTDSQREALAQEASAGLAGLREATCHLLVVPKPYSAEQWARQLDERVVAPSPVWPTYLAGVTEHVRGLELHERLVFLGVELEAPKAPGPWAKGRRFVEGAAGLSGPPVCPGDLERWAERSESLDLHLSASDLRGVRVPAAQLRWLVRRAFWRGLPEPAGRLRAGPAWGGELVALAGGTIRNEARKVVLEQDAGESHQAVLTVGWFAEELAFPGAEWLYRYEQVPGHIEASVRFRVVPPREVAKHAGRKLADITDQVGHISRTSSVVPIHVGRALETARALEFAVTKDQAPLLYSHARFIVSATESESLDSAVTRLCNAYRDLGIELVRPRGDQLRLFIESIPGGSMGTTTYEQVKAVQTLGGSMFRATAALGDGTGPYIGYTLGSGHTAGVRVPVHYDPLAAALRNRATVAAITGSLGGGKTTFAELLVYQAVLRGAQVTVVDPKGDALKLPSVPGLGGARVIDLGPGPEYRGLLDPFSLGEDSSEGALIAADTCQSILGLGRDRRDRQDLNAVIRACHAESGIEHPTLAGVARRLRAEPDPEVAAAGETLESIAELPLGRLCLAPGGKAVAPLRVNEGGLTIIGFAGLKLPAPGSATEDWALSERLSVSVMYLTAQMLRHLVEASDRSRPKLLMFDEAWALTASGQGSALIQRMARMGRSKNTATLLVSQNAIDLTDERVTNCISAKFAFRAIDDNEVAAILALLDLEPTPAHKAAITRLETGQCLFADLDGRRGAMAVDLVYEEIRAALRTTPDAMTVGEVA